MGEAKATWGQLHAPHLSGAGRGGLVLRLTKFALDQSQSLRPQLRNDFRDFPHLKKTHN